MVEVSPWPCGGFVVSSGEPHHEGLMLHGYGGDSGEMLPLAKRLAARMRLKLLVADLPGHGGATGRRLTGEEAAARLQSALSALVNPTFVIGHSLGARIGLTAGLETAILISMPGRAVFEGGQRELLRILRPRRVNEAAPFAGLKEILEWDAAPTPQTLLLCAENELESARALACEWSQAGVTCAEIAGSNHNDIVDTPETAAVITAWLEENLL